MASIKPGPARASAADLFAAAQRQFSTAQSLDDHRMVVVQAYRAALCHALEHFAAEVGLPAVSSDQDASNRHSAGPEVLVVPDRLVRGDLKRLRLLHNHALFEPDIPLGAELAGEALDRAAAAMARRS